MSQLLNPSPSGASHQFAEKHFQSQGNGTSSQSTPFESTAPIDEQEKIHLNALELDQASDFESVKQAYHRVSRKYHPDHYAQDPEKQKIATEVQRNLNNAFEFFKQKFQNWRQQLQFE